MIKDKENVLLSAISGLLLTASFPKIGVDFLAWFALVPFFWAIRNFSPLSSFRMGFITGLVHFLSLLYWVVPVMLTYGYLPLYLSISILFLFAAVLALFMALFAAVLAGTGEKTGMFLPMAVIAWIALEYLRSFIFSGFPWEFLGYSQFKRLQLIQISDIFGVYGLSALIVFCNASIFLTILYFAGKRWQGKRVSTHLVEGAILAVIIGIGITWFYGYQRIKTIDALAAASPSAKISVVQGNIDQTVKWDPAFQIDTVEKYNRLSASLVNNRPDLIVWPESATPFYFLYDRKPSELVFEGIHKTDADYLIGSPSVVQTHDALEYYNSAYLIKTRTQKISKYDKAHLVPYGEYIPLKKWLPFLGKIVDQVGDFKPGKKGNTLSWRDYRLGIQICYEVIFPDLSREMVRNDASLLINITNDAWFGKTSGPYQHFSMTVFRAVENRRALARAANTGISGFIDPAGRILASTALLEEAVATESLPLIQRKTFYTRFGDLFAMACFVMTFIIAAVEIGKFAIKFNHGRG